MSIQMRRRYFLIGFMALLGFGLWWLAAHDYAAYAHVMRLLGVDAVRPPFIDWVYIPANVNCWHQGIDVYSRNPCDPLGRVMDYSPLWLRINPYLLTHPRITPVAIDGIFCLSLALFPVSESRGAHAALLVAILSPATLFALERGNVDLIVFIMLMVAVHLYQGSTFFRFCSHAIVGVAGLLKYYPLAAATIIFKAGSRRFVVAVAFGYLLLIGTFAIEMWGEILRSLGNVPAPNYLWGGAFSAQNMPYVIVQIINAGFWGQTFSPSPDLPGILPSGLAAAAQLLLTVCIIVSAAMSNLIVSWIAPNRLSNSRHSEILFIVAASVASGCFFLGQSILYRQIFLLPALPMLLHLSTKGMGTERKAARLACGIIVFLMWIPAIQGNLFAVVHTGMHPGFTVWVLWLVRESMWWALVTILDAMLLIYLVPDLAVRFAGLDRAFTSPPPRPSTAR